MYKRLLALLLAFVMVFALLPVSAFAEGEGQEGASEEIKAAADGLNPVELSPVEPTEPAVTDTLPAENVIKPVGDGLLLLPDVTEAGAGELEVLAPEEGGEGFATLTVSIAVEAGNSHITQLVGAVTVGVVNIWTNDVYTAEIANPQGGSVTLTLPVGEYSVSYSGAEAEGHCSGLEGTDNVVLNSGESRTLTRTAKYVKEPGEPATTGRVTVNFSFDADSSLSGAEAPGINLYAGGSRVAVLTHENGRSASFEMDPGTYTFQCGGIYVGLNRFIQTSEMVELTVEAGKEYTVNMTGKYIAQGLLKARLTFAEDSPLQADSGVRIRGIIYKDGSYEVVYYTAENNYYREIRLDCGTYTLEFEPVEVENYKCVVEPVTFTIEAYQDCIITPVVSVEPISCIAFEFLFPEDCPLENYEEVYIYAGVSLEENDHVEIVCLYAGNNFRGALAVKPGDYNISYICFAPAGYWIFISEDNFTVRAGETYYLSREVPVDVVAAVHFQVLYDEDSVIDAVQAGTVELEIYRYDDGFETKRYLRPQLGYKISESLYPGRYRFRFIPEDIGTCMHTGTQTVFVTVEAGKEYNIQCPLKYVESATVNLEIVFAEDSAIGAEDITKIEPLLVTNDGRPSWMYLSAETGWKASIAVPAAETVIGVSPPYFSGYKCTTPDYESMTFEPGETYTIRKTLKYVKTDEEKGRVTVTLQFDESSPISAESLGDITVNFKDSGGAEYTAQMPAGNDRSAEIELYPGNYTVSFEGTAVEGYSTNLELIRKIVCKSGETTELVYTAMYNKIQQEGDNTDPKPLPGVGTGNSGDSPIKPIYPNPSPAPTVPDPFNPPVITPIYPDDNKRGEEIELPGSIIVNAPEAEQSDAITVSYPDKEAEAEQSSEFEVSYPALEEQQQESMGAEPLRGQSEKAAAASVEVPAAASVEVLAAAKEAGGSETGDAGSVGILAISAAGMLALGAAALLVSKKRKENE